MDNFRETTSGTGKMVPDVCTFGDACDVFFLKKGIEDMEEFSRLVGQKVGMGTKSIWYPRLTERDFITGGKDGE